MTNRIGQIGNFHQELFKNHYQESMVPFMSVAQKNKYLNAVNSKSPKVDYHSSQNSFFKQSNNFAPQYLDDSTLGSLEIAENIP